MRKQDFVKLVMYVTSKQMDVYEADKLIACKVMMKNDPKECMIHICDEDNTYDFTFYEHDDYHNSKFEIDFLFDKIFNTNKNEDRN